MRTSRRTKQNSQSPTADAVTNNVSAETNHLPEGSTPTSLPKQSSNNTTTTT